MFQGNGKKNILVTGNSHAASVLFGLKHAFHDVYSQMTIMHIIWCMPFLGLIFELAFIPFIYKQSCTGRNFLNSKFWLFWIRFENLFRTRKWLVLSRRFVSCLWLFWSFERNVVYRKLVKFCLFKWCLCIKKTRLSQHFQRFCFSLRWLRAWTTQSSRKLETANWHHFCYFYLHEPGNPPFKSLVGDDYFQQMPIFFTRISGVAREVVFIPDAQVNWPVEPLMRVLNQILYFHANMNLFEMDTKVSKIWR